MSNAFENHPTTLENGASVCGVRPVAVALVSLLLFSLAPQRAQGGGAEPNCEDTFPSTFALLQRVIFENRGCTSAFCHDAAASGGLDLTAEHAYDELLEQPTESVTGWLRVKPGRKDESLLFVNLAARTIPDAWTAPRQGMPLGGLPPISFDELDALRLWIERGAPRDGTVPGTAELLNACLPPPRPIEIAPLPPPAEGHGVQLHMPPWILNPKSESEVCLATYYDFTGQVPEEFLSADGTKLRFERTEVRQNPVSHHLIVNLYTGSQPATSSAWGTYRCRGGERNGELCEPTDLDSCGEDSGCASDATPAVGCIGFGPSDSQISVASPGIALALETAADNTLFDGVYDELPLKGIIVWNSHAFNTTQEDAKVEAWLNLHFARKQDTPVQRIFGAPGLDQLVLTTFSKVNVPAFGRDEVCATYVLPPNAHLFELSSHNHKRGKRFRILHGAFTCRGGPNDGEACSPFGTEEGAHDLCAGSRCSSIDGPEVGDCDGDHAVSVAELVRTVKAGLGSAAEVAACPRADANGDGRTTIDELVSAVDGSLHGFGERDPDDSLLFTNRVYDDPFVLRFDPPWVPSASDAFPDERTLTYCSLYDNGFTDPSKVKRQSTSPVPAGIPLGGPCEVPTGCISGRVKEACGRGDDEETRDDSCDSSPGAGDGICDACPLLGGVTTEDEMFLILGSYFVP
jgi:hypothetical protein